MYRKEEEKVEACRFGDGGWWGVGDDKAELWKSLKRF